MMMIPTKKHKCFVLLFSELCCLLAAASNILLLGDSMAELSYNYVSGACPNSKVVNSGVSSSTAAEWAASSTNCPAGGGASCSAATAFAAAPQTTHVWLSVGGNDFLDGGCLGDATSLQSLTTTIQNAITTVRAAVGSQVKIVMTGYCIAKMPLSEFGGNCGTRAALNALNTAVGQATVGLANVEYVDASYFCGATATSYSDPAFFLDAIHLNQLGYCTVFTEPGVQTALSCSGGTSVAACTSATVPQQGGGAGSSFSHMPLFNILHTIYFCQELPLAALGL